MKETILTRFKKFESDDIVFNNRFHSISVGSSFCCHDFKDIKFIFEKSLTSKYDNLIIDINRPDQKIRKNFTEVLKI